MMISSRDLLIVNLLHLLKMMNVFVGNFQILNRFWSLAFLNDRAMVSVGDK